MTSTAPFSPLLEEAARSPGDRLRLLGRILDGVEQAVVATDREGKVLFWNRCAEQMCGWPAEEVLGRSLKELLVPEASREQALAIREHLSRGERWSGEFRVHRRDGSTVPVHVTDSPILDENGQLVGMVGVATDISSRQHLEEAVRRYESFQQLSSRVAFEALWDWDLRSGVVRWSGGSSFGYPATEMQQGLAWWEERLHPNDREPTRISFRSALESVVREYTAEYRFRRSDGSYASVAARCHFERNAAGCATRVVGVIIDVGSLDAAEKRLRLFREQIPALAWATDSHLCVLWTVGSAFHAREGCLVGRSLRQIPAVSAQSIEAHLKALQGEASRYEVRFRDRVANLRVEPFRDETGTIVGAVGVALDVTDLRRAEEALEKTEGQRNRAQDELAHRLQQQAAVAELGLSALRAVELQSLFDEATTLAIGALRADASELMEPLPDGNLLLRAGVGWKENTVGRFTVSGEGDSLCAYTLRCNQPVVVEDFAAESRFAPSRDLGDGLVSAVSVPVHGRDESFGVLGVYSRRRRSYSQDDLNFLQSIANVLATAIERERADGELRAKGTQLQRLSHRLLEAQEAERRSIARELHDDFGQVLTAIRLNLIADGDPVERIALVDDAIQRMRDLALDLRPAILDDLGLEAALRWYVPREARRAGLWFRLDVRSIGKRLPAAVETACFRLVQEALTNIVRHARALTVEVELAAPDGEVRLAVRDDGRGFDVRAAKQRAGSGASQGLLIMEERVSLAGGKLDIFSTPGRGTSIRARLRVPEATSR